MARRVNWGGRCSSPPIRNFLRIAATANFVTMMDSSSDKPQGTPFSFTPWAQPPRNQAARRWRKRCEPAVAHIFEAISPRGYTSTRSKTNPSTAADYMVDAIFEENPTANPADRLDLICWLGAACAIGGKADQPWLVRGSLSQAVGEMIERWAGAAWKQPTSQERVDWADVFIIRTCAGKKIVDGPHQKWGDIPAVWTPGVVHARTNAQTDLLMFLDSFEKQALKQADVVTSLLPNTVENQRIAWGAMALRIFYGTMGEMADPRLLEPLTFFQSRYDHQHINGEILRMAGTAVDRRILRGVVTDADGTDADGTDPTHRAAGPRRKL